MRHVCGARTLRSAGPVRALGGPGAGCPSSFFHIRRRYDAGHALGAPPRVLLPAPHDGIAVPWLELEADASPSHALACHERRARPDERIVDKVPNTAAVLERPLDQDDRLLCGMQIGLPESALPRNTPHVSFSC